MGINVVNLTPETSVLEMVKIYDLNGKVLVIRGWA